MGDPMDHGPAVKLGKDNASEWKAKLGVILFFVYAAFYACFVTIIIVKPKLMSITVFAGLNLAVVYGFGLIVLAIIMGLLYNHFCTKKENKLNDLAQGGTK
jgi:uncharacterized membrane protein (DUF485 family)